MGIINDKELFELRDDILAGKVVMVTKEHFNKLEVQALSQQDLLAAGKAIIGDKPDKYGYGAAGNAMNDEIRANLKAAIDKAA